MSKRFFILMALVALLASCQRELDRAGEPEMKASVEEEPETRTSISVISSGTGTIYWSPSDKIDVFFGTKKATYTSQNTSNARTATFKTSSSISGSDLSSTNIWGLYPSNNSSSCNGSAISTTLPSTQYGVAGTFDNGPFPAIAHGTSTSLQFYNVCGGIKFNMVYDDIKKVTFRGNNNEDLAGKVSISLVNGLPKATIVNGVKEITLTPKTGSTFTQGADYYITLLSGTLSNGFTMTFTTTDGSVAYFNNTEVPVTIKRSVFSRKSNVDVYASFGDGRQPNNVFYYTTEDANGITPSRTKVFGADIVSNEYVGGRGIITFDGEMKSIGERAFYYCAGLTSIAIPNSVTGIGMDAFYSCFRLTSVVIPNSVTDIGTNPFSACSGLTSILIDSGNSAYDSRNSCNALIKTDTNELISGCMNTIIPNSVTGIGNKAFYYCYRLTSINIPDSVTSIGDSAFSFCSGLTSIVIPNSVLSIGGYAFGYCGGLTSITIPDSVTDIGPNPFPSCDGLISIVVESGNSTYDSRNNCNAIVKTETNELITGCKNTSIPNTVTSIGDYAFAHCYGLTSVFIPSSVISIGDSAFGYCSDLRSITLNGSTPPLLGPNAFKDSNGCPIYVPAQSVDTYKSAWSEYADRIQAIPDSHEAVDLGLPSGLKWATCNVGASSPEEYGDYFAWGETEPKEDYSWETYKWCMGSDKTMTKYCSKSSYGYNGFTDYKKVLDLEDDAAHVALGGQWRMPTEDEWNELLTQCTWEWTTMNGINGKKVTGPNGNSIFLPPASFHSGPSIYSTEPYGNYWSSSCEAYSPDFAMFLDFGSSNAFTYMAGYGRFLGLSVRPVKE